MQLRVRRRWVALTLLLFWVAWESIFRPIYNLNVERWAEEHGADRLLVEWGPSWMTAVLERVLGDYILPFVAFLLGDFGLGFAIGALLFSLADWPAVTGWIRRRRESTTSDENKNEQASSNSSSFPSSGANHVAWMALIDDLEKQYKTNPKIRISDVLMANTEFYRLEPYLSQQTRDALQKLSTGAQIHPKIMIAGEETPERSVIRMIKEDIARYERDMAIPVEEKSRMIEEAHAMVDRIDAQNHKGELTERITDIIRRTKEYQRISAHLSQNTRELINLHPRRVIGFEVGTFEDYVIERMREDIADLARRWRLA